MPAMVRSTLCQSLCHANDPLRPSYHLRAMAGNMRSCNLEAVMRKEGLVGMALVVVAALIFVTISVMLMGCTTVKRCTLDMYAQG